MHAFPAVPPSHRRPGQPSRTGNHCLSVPRATVLKRLGVPDSCYYSVALRHRWRLVVLDTTEMSGHSDYPEVGGWVVRGWVGGWVRGCVGARAWPAGVRSEGGWVGVGGS